MKLKDAEYTLCNCLLYQIDHQGKCRLKKSNEYQKKKKTNIIWKIFVILITAIINFVGGIPLLLCSMTALLNPLVGFFFICLWNAISREQEKDNEQKITG
ncbi:MAG: hypothetical protein Dasosvirus4_30 [Dasosvirus sp.]|uniref:Uncharacterized protein n=1 Tax=Dasosvirus sp. TaxID=2487764 RepID=A0A3G4ZVP0_9VIRU|nr:MAG: hypothetical protein Dasosvirus4_30 [Dasosvirus sp.]